MRGEQAMQRAQRMRGRSLALLLQRGYATQANSQLSPSLVLTHGVVACLSKTCGRFGRCSQPTQAVLAMCVTI